MEFIFELIFGVYVELMMYIVPEGKATSRKHRILASLLAGSVLFGVLALFIWGCVLICDYNNKLGAIPIAVVIVLSIGQIIAGFVLHDRKPK